MTPQRKTKRRDQDWLDRRLNATVQEPLARRLCEDMGLTLHVSVVTSGKTTFPHWVVRYDGNAILHYWPTSGTYRVPATEQKGQAEWEDALRLAVVLVNAAPLG